ncbi:FAD-dependent monooxygenase [Sphingomonas gei]|uniref:FAD-dependent monooxygenase n=1 Tax=Sphingomonas gei TaxID=1395960 RepID=A0A4S1XB50_9SPHN|nr:NAD(P)/FAD-dependent oxidoreductase [Sphingomonas gei]TGX53341.1 FAD-dependent monooxygenase [Sphingomonas gei]
MPPLEIAIAGCGPAGLAAALLLHRDGHHVTLFERFDAARPIGSGLMIQPTGLGVLRALGLEDRLLAHGARIARLTGEASGRSVLDVHYAALDGDRFGVGIHRASLFEILHAAVEAAGIAVRTGCEVEGSAREGARRRLHLKDGRSVLADLVVDALGARSALATGPTRALAYGALWASVPWQSGFDETALQQRYRRASVMAGVLPTGARPGTSVREAAFFWSLRADRLDEWRARGLDAWKAEVTALWPATRPLLDDIVDLDQLTFARYAHRTLGTPAEPGLIHIGDAWHSTSPQLGQGANMALLDAWAMALALRGHQTLDGALLQAVKLRRRHVRIYQAMSRLLTPVYQSDGRLIPLLRDRLVGPISKLGPVMRLQAAMVSGLIGAPLRPLGLA